MQTSSWIRFRLVHARQLFTALILGLALIGIQGCGSQKSAPESPSPTVQTPTPTGQLPSGAPIPKLTPVPGSVVGLVLEAVHRSPIRQRPCGRPAQANPSKWGKHETSADGGFELGLGGSPDKDTILYLVAKGGEPTGSAVKGYGPTINILDGTAISGTSLGLRIAAGNVPNFVTSRRRLRCHDSRRIQQHANANDGEFRDTFQRAGWLRQPRKGGRLRQSVRWRPDRKATCRLIRWLRPIPSLATVDSNLNESSRCWMRFIQCRRANTFAPPRTCLI